jgi:hypothetical protein
MQRLDHSGPPWRREGIRRNRFVDWELVVLAVAVKLRTLGWRASVCRVPAAQRTNRSLNWMIEVA